MLLTQLMKTKVVSRETAEKIGDVRNVLVDVASRRITVVQVGKGRKGRLADWDDVAVGPDAVVVSSEAALHEPRSESEARVLGGDVTLLDARVLTDHGDALGTVSDVELDEASGAVTALTVDSRSVDTDRLLAVGTYAVVVRGDAGG
ncbi:MAG: PRC-barrel domain-containing protein [Actinomycetota bacterium]|nr:PRC-barrel domain-containing protein [Actinomycetota bacterium]